MFRIPSWANGASLKSQGSTPQSATPGTLKASECDGSFDVMLTFPMKIRVSRRYNNAVSVHNG